MRAILETMKQIVIAEPAVTIKSAVHEDTKQQMEMLAEALVQENA